MTGEITLHGRVMPIGGLREKSMAAYKAGIRTVLIPEDNRADLEEVDDVVKDAVTFIPVRYLSEVLSLALVQQEAKKTTVSGNSKKTEKPTASVRA